MGMMERMRTLSPWLIGTVIATFLILMVLGDVDLPQIFNFGGAVRPTTVVGVVEGEKILYKDFEERVRQTAEQQRKQMQQQGIEQEVDDNLIREQVWNQYVNEILMRKEAERAGVFVTPDEIADVLLLDPPDYLKKAFTDSAGVFHRDRYVQLITDPESYADILPDDPSIDKEEEVAKWKRNIIEIENSILLQRMQQKLQNLAGWSASAFSPTYLERRSIAENSYVAMDYVFLNAMNVTLPPNAVTDDEIRSYYEAHKQYYKTRPMRKIKYINFPIVPSSTDSARTRKLIEQISTDLAAQTDPVKRDSVFTHYFATVGGRTQTVSKPTDIDPAKQAFLLGLDVRGVAGPVTLNNKTYFFRLDHRGPSKDTTVRASHILIGFGTNKDSARAVAEQVLARVRGGEDFGKVAQEVSEDKGSASRGGDLDYFGRGRMVKPFEDAAFAASVGSIVGPVESQFGYHIIKVTDRKTESIEFSEIEIQYSVSPQTKKALLRQAYSVMQQLENGENIDSLGKRLGKQVIESVFFDNTQPFLGSMEVTQFAFAHKVGEVSRPFELRFYGYTVVQVSGVREKGIKPLEDVKDQIRDRLLSWKRVEKLKERAEQLARQLQQAGRLDAVKSIDSTLTVMSAARVTEQGQLPTGVDVALAVQAFKLPVGKISSAVRGESGYYIVLVRQRHEVDSAGRAAGIEAIARRKKQEAMQNAFFTWLNNRRQNADIEDNRAEIYSR
ncbi:MAG: peptidylprolyl isomerase [Candidatus Kapaibacterium sp.]|nr:MAG: peptidylprolyl isomerase [Candidatus Kapabacteria bacterium]